MADVPIHNATETLRTTAIGVIFRKTIRGSYASLDLLEGDTHIIALIQFYDLKLKEEITSARSFIRRECKLGSQIHLDGVWQNNRFQVRLKHVGDGDTENVGFRIIQRQKIDMTECQKAR